MGQRFTTDLNVTGQSTIDALRAHLQAMRVVMAAEVDFPHEPPVRIVVDSEIELTLRAPACAKEPETCAWIREEVKPGDVFYDVGANVGSYSLVAAALGARVVAFEPNPTAYRQLTRNLQLNGFLTALPLPVALGARSRVGALVVNSPLSGASAHLDGEGGWLPVIVLPLDTLLLEDVLDLPFPTHLKVDTDGAERDVLAGAAAALAFTQTAMIECTAENEREVVAWMKNVGLGLVSRHPRIQADVANLRFARS